MTLQQRLNTFYLIPCPGWHSSNIPQVLSRFIRSTSRISLDYQEPKIHVFGFPMEYNPKKYRSSQEHPILMNPNVYRVYPCMCYSEFPFDTRASLSNFITEQTLAITEGDRQIPIIQEPEPDDCLYCGKIEKSFDGSLKEWKTLQRAFLIKSLKEASI